MQTLLNNQNITVVKQHQNLQTDKYFIGKATFSFPAKKSSHAQWYFSNNPQALGRVFYNVPANIINFTWG